MTEKEMALVRIKIDENQNEQIIILKEKDGNRLIPIVIGMSEVNAIKMKLSGIKPPRPLTHDLLIETAEKLGGRLAKILIDKLENNTFHAKIFFSKNGDEISVDARPSDSVALALRANAPIFCDENILAQAGVEE